jgi:4-amino-4-deoxy-L-arabinose transferase-like glycosyltransferase
MIHSRRCLVAMAVAVLTAVALVLRFGDLWGLDGTLSVDEARLALAARAVVQRGIPAMETGWTYTRGLPATYLTALSFMILGESDFAARLPSVLAGTATVTIMFLLGRAVGGLAGGLFAAAFVAIYPPLVVWSRVAWFYALYVLIYAAALLAIVRAHQSRGERWPIWAGVLVGLATLTHELGAFLLAPLIVLVALERSRSTLIGLAIALACVTVKVALAFALRSPTLAGGWGEVVEYFSPHLEGIPFRFYGRMLVDGRWLMLVIALAGIPLAITRRAWTPAFLWLALALSWLHAVAIIPERPQERYGLTFIVPLTALAVWSAAEWATVAARWIRPSILTAIVLSLTLVVHQDVARALERRAFSPRDGAWLREARAVGIGPGDTIMTDIPTLVGWYIGGLDYWVSSRDYQKYTAAREAARVDIHTGAVLVRNPAEYRQLVAQSHRGQAVWVIASGRSFQWGELVDDDLRNLLERSAVQRINGADGSRLLRLEP